MSACPAMIEDGVVRGVLAAVDCQTRDFAQSGYLALTQPGSPFQAALTIIMTIYVALLGYRLLFAAGGARISEGLGVALRIGVVLALVTSWATFQTLVFDLAGRAPKEIAAMVSAPLLGEGSTLARDPVAGLQIAYDQLTLSAVTFGKSAGPMARTFSSPEAAAANALATATGAMFLGCVGLIAVATIAIGVLTALGPLFIALFLIPQTRGLFVGWVRALVAAAIVPMGAWILNLMMLLMLDPWLAALAEQRRALVLDPQTAMSAASVVLVFTGAQVAMALAAGFIAFSFNLTGRSKADAAEPARAEAIARAAAAENATAYASRAQILANDLRRGDAGAASAVDIRRLSAAAGTAAAPSGRGAASEAAPPRLGDTYRRPALSGRSASSRRLA